MPLADCYSVVVENLVPHNSSFNLIVLSDSGTPIACTVLPLRHDVLFCCIDLSSWPLSDVLKTNITCNREPKTKWLGQYAWLFEHGERRDQ